MSGAGAAASEEGSPIPPVSPPDGFSPDSIPAAYTGTAVVHRLVFLAFRCPDLKTQALALAHDAVKSGGTSTSKYREIFELGGDLGPGRAFDEAWVSETDATADTRRKVLERELSTHLANQSRFHIRRGNIDLARFYYERGDTAQALACYNRAFDYSTPQEKAEHFVTVAQLSMEVENWTQVDVFLRKLQSFPADPLIHAKARVLSGLMMLQRAEYRGAASAFVDVLPDIAAHFSEVVTAEDVAIYGGLCALASFSRRDLKTKVLGNKSFQSFLDVVPPMKEAVTAFHACRYSACLHSLEQLRGALSIDFFMYKHIDAVMKAIMSRGISQYFAPYSAVKLGAMAEAFNTSVEALTDLVAELVMAGDIQGRIDSQNQILVSRATDVRVDAFAEALKIGHGFARDVQSTILRARMAQHGFQVKQSKASRRKGGRGAGAAGATSGDVGAMAAGGEFAEFEVGGPQDGDLEM